MFSAPGTYPAARCTPAPKKISTRRNVRRAVEQLVEEIAVSLEARGDAFDLDWLRERIMESVGEEIDQVCDEGPVG